jgi:cytochrome P450
VRSVAGSDTTATVIRSTLLHIITNPRVFTKLRQEIDAVVQITGVMSDENATQMKYLQAVIKEGLRIFPPVAGLMSKQTPPEGDHWKGVFIPGGTRIGLCAWGIFRREDIWGEDSEEFRPERWLEVSADSLRNMESVLDLNFSYGRWQCLGRPIAVIELNKIFVQVKTCTKPLVLHALTKHKLLRQFDLTLCDPLNPWKIYNCGIFSQEDFRIRVRRREF